MRKLISLFFVLLVICGIAQPVDTLKSDVLKVARIYDPSRANPFDLLPMTVSEAESQRFRKIRNCTGNSKFKGFPYIKNNDYGIVSLFDVNGVSAGIQFSIPKLEYNASLRLPSPFLQDEGRWVMTVYFDEPAKICTTGRSKSNFQKDGSGSKYFLQTGESTDSNIVISRNQVEIDTKKWIKGPCVSKIGQHYWLTPPANVGCAVSLPVFLVYANSELVAFGWSHISRPDLRVPIPPLIHHDLANLFMGAAPACLRPAAVADFVYIFLIDKQPAKACPQRL